jgi:hypothetical protein
MSTPPGILTGISALDCMLFGDDYYREPRASETGFRSGEVVLIRGEPGSGKTTLGLQIAANYYRKNVDNGADVQFMTLEESSSAMITRGGKYGFEADKFSWIERKQIDGLIDELRRLRAAGRRSEGYLEAARKIAQEALRALRKILPPSQQALLDVAEGVLAAGPVINLLLTAILALLVRNARPERADGDCPSLVVIDSLNALMNLLITMFPKEPPRLLFNTFCQVLRQYFAPPGKADGKLPPEPPVIIIIGEHHFHEPDTEKYLPESFFCDTEIVLRPEPVRLPRDSDPAANMTLGYDLAAVVDREAKHLESRSFCRVIKARGYPRQSRRCAYDIESGEGFRFFETYPGDGKLMLFAENEQQRSAWTSFFQRDLTDAYPALRYETFGMEGLETVYDSSRRLLHVPLRTDMFLSSLDSYWVTGYRDYRLKTHINERLKKMMPQEWAASLERSGGDRSVHSTFVCMEYPAFVNGLVYYTLTRFERDLCKRNRAALAAHALPARRNRRARYDKRLEKLTERIVLLKDRLADLRKELSDRFDGMCLHLIGKSVETLLAKENEKDLLPKKQYGETFLRPLPRSQVALYGQYNADLLPALIRDDMHQFEDGEDYWLSIPYDANLGVFVARLDLLNKVLRDEGVQARYEEKFRELKERECKVLRLAKKDAKLLLPNAEKAELDEFRVQMDEEINRCLKQATEGAGTLPDLARLAVSREQRLTWDQVISLSAATHMPIGIETRSFDTLMATFLELVWNCDGKLEVNARYQICERAKNILPLIRALHYFAAIFSLTPTPPDQSVDPANAHRGSGKPSDYGHWLFARYWYSTLLDAFTAPSPAQKPAGGPQPTAENSAGRFAWQPAPEAPRPQLEIILMPTGHEKTDKHYTCWGDWSFGLLEGSENVSLACDLVSNLMGDQKVTERGLRGACLPTVSHFYWRYRDEPCVPATIRDDIDLPKMTFGQLGRTYLGTSNAYLAADDAAQALQAVAPSGADGAPADPPNLPPPEGIFRQSIFDYRHCAREIFGELLRIKRNINRSATPGGAPSNAEAEAVVGACINIVRGIEELGIRYIFIRDSFRHDVAKLALRDVDPHQDWRKRPPRMPRVAPRNATLHFAGGPRKLLNISRGGLCFEGKVPTTTGPSVGLTIPKVATLQLNPLPDTQYPHSRFQFDKPIAYRTYYDLLATLL